MLKEEATKISEEKFYPIIAKWLYSKYGCQYSDIRKSIWGKQIDVLGIKFRWVEDYGIRADLYMIEVKVIDALNSIYNLIGEIEVRIALFLNKSHAFYALYPYIAIVNSHRYDEVNLYADNRGVGIIEVKNSEKGCLNLKKEPNPIISGRILVRKNFENYSWIKDKDEERVFIKAVKTMEWWRLRELMTKSSI